MLALWLCTYLITLLFHQNNLFGNQSANFTSTCRLLSLCLHLLCTNMDTCDYLHLISCPRHTRHLLVTGANTMWCMPGSVLETHTYTLAALLITFKDRNNTPERHTTTTSNMRTIVANNTHMTSWVAMGQMNGIWCLLLFVHSDTDLLHSEKHL